MSEPRRIAVATFGRSDFSILRPLCRLLLDDPDHEVGMWVGGAHFEEISGRTVQEIEHSGIPIWARIDGTASDRSALGTVNAMAAQLSGFGNAAAAVETATVEVTRPPADLVLILGDRFEAIAAGLAMVPLGIPVGHISGGSVTEGAIDDVFRHCLTKIAAIHFCDLPRHARRIQLMGEPSERVITTGALGLDAFVSATIHDIETLVERFALTGLRPGYALATLHPETRRPDLTRPTAEAMIRVLAEADLDVVLTYPNADPGADQIIGVLERAAATHERLHLVRGFGAAYYPTAMAHAALMVGNSSSGIIEAASFDLPVVDIGDRQKGRDRGANVIHCESEVAAITEAIRTARSAPFREKAMSGNIYGDGNGAQRVIAALRSSDLEALTAPKVFADPVADFTGERLELA